MRPIIKQWLHDLYARHRTKIVIAEFVIVFALGAVVSWFLFSGSGPAPSPDGAAVTSSAEKPEGPSFWTCSMHPQIRQAKAGKCPICGMALIPVQSTSGGLRTLVVSPETKALMDIATAPVQRQYVEHVVRMVGKVDYDETRLGYITAWVPGRLDRMYVDYTGVQVAKGDHTVYMYSEKLYTAQAELIQALKFSRQSAGDRPLLLDRMSLVDAAREKLRLLGMTDEQIKEVEQSDKAADHVTIYSPVSGIVIEKLKQQGDRVEVGERIYTIADLSQLWVHLDAYESDLPWIKYGQQVIFMTEAYPGEEFPGRIVFVQPVLNDRTRTVKVRVNVDNKAGKLKPDMFVHATVRAKVAAGGRVLDPSLAGKWISPMHPEIIKDEPGMCDVCGMPLVRAETLGFVAADTGEQARPLVIAKSAVMVTGTRAIVYVELPTMQGGVEPLFQNVSAAVSDGNVDKIRKAFDALSKYLDQPYNQPGTDYARRTWNEFADELGRHALAGQRVQNAKQAEQVFATLEQTMKHAREMFAPQGQPTYEGREIVLGPRAGDYYLVRHGLEDGELVVTQGTFKIDSEIQIQAKPSMMTPEGGGGGGHDHGGHGGEKKPSGEQHAGHTTALPTDFHNQIRELEAAFDDVTASIKEADVQPIKQAFAQFGRALESVDGNLLTGHPRMLWKEFAMLLGNDAFEGSEVQQRADADRVYLLLKSHMRRMRDQMRMRHEMERKIERIEVPAEFRQQLAKLWRAYVPMQQTLAADDYAQARATLGELQSAFVAIDEQPLSDGAKIAWSREKRNLSKVLDALQSAEDIEALRAAFSLLSDEISVLAKAFGFGDVGPIYELHCPMAFEGRGAIWFQTDNQAKNPYYGATMLKCADRVELLAPDNDDSKDDAQHVHEGHKQ